MLVHRHPGWLHLDVETYVGDDDDDDNADVEDDDDNTDADDDEDVDDVNLDF